MCCPDLSCRVLFNLVACLACCVRPILSPFRPDHFCVAMCCKMPSSRILPLCALFERALMSLGAPCFSLSPPAVCPLCCNVPRLTCAALSCLLQMACCALCCFVWLCHVATCCVTSRNALPCCEWSIILSLCCWLMSCNVLPCVSFVLSSWRLWLQNCALACLSLAHSGLLPGKRWKNESGPTHLSIKCKPNCT